MNCASELTEASERLEILKKIELAIHEFIEIIFARGDYSPEEIPFIENEHTTENKTEHSVESPNSRRFLRKNQPALIAYRLRVLCQVYVPSMSWGEYIFIYSHALVLNGRKSTRRDLYYEDKRLFLYQHNLNRALTYVCNFLGYSRRQLNVISCSRGFVIGDLKLWNSIEGDPVDFSVSPVAIFESLLTSPKIESQANFVLVVEKDSIFQKLLDEGYTATYPHSILVSGRGYPDICTRHFLVWLSNQLKHVPFFGLMDADPYGIEIFLTYKYGGRKRVESGTIERLSINLIGLCSSDVTGLPISEQHRLPLMPSDKKRISRLLEKIQRFNVEEKIAYELDFMKTSGYKLELEALSSIRPKYLTEIYLHNQLEQQNNS